MLLKPLTSSLFYHTYNFFSHFWQQQMRFHRFSSVLRWLHCILGYPTCFYRENSYLPLKFDSLSPSSISKFSPHWSLFCKSTTRFFFFFFSSQQKKSFAETIILSLQFLTSCQCYYSHLWYQRFLLHEGSINYDNFFFFFLTSFYQPHFVVSFAILLVVD